MEFKISDSGTPYIQLDSGRLIFSKNTAHPNKGYKYVCYCGTETATTCISSARAKIKRYAKVVEDVNFTLRVKDFRRDDKKAFPTKFNVISKISQNFIKNLITKNVVGEHLPFHVIPYIMEQVNMEDETDGWDYDPDIDDSDDDEEETESYIPKTKLTKGKGNRKKSLKIKRNVTFKNVKSIKKGK